MSVWIGTAGWSIPKAYADQVPREGSSLVRYSRIFGCAEINSTFYRSHRLATYERWAESVPAGFRFAVKVPKTITHECGLAAKPAQFRAFLQEVERLGDKLGPLLVQLPPRQGFDEGVARRFFRVFRDEYPCGHAAVEPRHVDWFGPEAEALLREFRMARVAADPAKTPEAARPGGDPALVYYRLHGSPRMYSSSYTDDFLGALGAELEQRGRESQVWCIFDNTASGAALGNALGLGPRVRDLT